MAPGHYPESSYPTYGCLSSLRLHAIDFDFEPHRLPNQDPRSVSFHHVPVGYPTDTVLAQCTPAHDPVGISLVKDEPLWHQSPTV